MEDMPPVPDLPLVVTGGVDARLAGLQRRCPGLDVVVVRAVQDIPQATEALASALFAGREIRVHGGSEEGSPAANAVGEARAIFASTVGTLCDRADEWLHNIGRSAGRLARLLPASSLDGRCPSRPALVVGAGPSLDRCGEALDQVADRCLVVAAGSALAPLARRGVTADVAVIIEGKDCSRQLEPPADLSRTWLAAAQHGHPAHLDARAAGVLRLDLSENRWVADLFGAGPSMASGGNVGASAVALAIRLGCDPLYLAGLDFAAPQGHGDHAEGSTSGPFGPEAGAIHGVAAAGGGSTRASELLVSYRVSLERMLRNVGGSRRVVNLSSGGAARIRGTTESSPEAVLKCWRGDAVPGGHFLKLAAGRAADWRCPSPESLAVRLDALQDELVEYVRRGERLLAEHVDVDRLRRRLLAPLVERPGSLASVLFHGFLLRPAADVRESWARRGAAGRDFASRLRDAVLGGCPAG